MFWIKEFFMKNKYSPSEWIRNVYDLVMTKIIMRQARFIRRPVFIRGGAIARRREKSDDGTVLPL